MTGFLQAVAALGGATPTPAANAHASTDRTTTQRGRGAHDASADRARAEIEARHEKWAAEFRERWKARDDAEELYLRRCSEVALQQMLDDAGVPAGPLSLNGRVAAALGLYAKGTTGTPTPARRAHRAPGANDGDARRAARGALQTVPADPWPVASSGLSLHVGPMTVRFDGGSPSQRKALAAFISRSRTWVEALLGLADAKVRRGGRA